MKISFLVTYYNQERYVRESLDSILATDKPEEWEILVGDDGSTDHTVDIVREYMAKDPEHIFLFIMPREQGVRYHPVRRASANRLNLLSHCTGDCFCTLDGDDFYCDRSFVKEAIDIFHKRQDVSLVSFGYKLFSEGVITKEETLPIQGGTIIHTEEYIRSFYLHSGAGVHRILWDQDRLQYIRNIGYFDDNDIVMNTLKYGKMYFINQSVYVYRQTGESVFTGMKQLEQAVLNVLGYDVDKQLIDDQYQNALTIRNTQPILQMYNQRNQLRTSLGEELFSIYQDICRGLKDSLADKLLNYHDLEEKEKKDIRKLVYWLKIRNMKVTVRMRGQRILRGNE